MPLVIARALAVAVVLLLISCSLVLFPTIRCIPAIVTTYTKWGLELYFNGSDEGWMTRPKVVVHASTEPTIPRIIHQVLRMAAANSQRPTSLQMWKTTQVPEQWLPVVDSCRRMYPDWQYIMWTDETMHSFVQTHFPSFLDQYEAYPYNIQRADAFRYLVLLEMGGVYIDMDVGCVRRLVRDAHQCRPSQTPPPQDPLLHNTVVLPATRPLGFSNEFMMAAPGAPFMARLVRRLPAWATNFGTKYPTVMFSTGPMFVTVQHAVYEHAREEVC